MSKLPVFGAALLAASILTISSAFACMETDAQATGTSVTVASSDTQPASSTAAPASQPDSN